ncbi:hypothetical protein [uncultured Marinobacter sp.]|uniref:hypothetical protein n=1 Tax=uncultured Marinobacter sp. TaxID=187379 RepID=UPI0025FF4842|nr:hypothetical protein [uncultured Marinobacter sp.]
MGKFKKLTLATAISSAFVLTGCGGSSGGSSDAVDNNDTGDTSTTAETGVFVDAAVAGINYTTSPGGQSGQTNELGEYNYEAGDTVVFSIGGIDLPAVEATGRITPADMGSGTTDWSSDQTVVNILRLLQTLDSDDDASNGITITEDVHTALQDIDLDPSVSETDFETQANTAINTTGKTLIAKVDAVNHFQSSQSGDLVGSWVFEESNGNVNVLTFLNDSEYLIAHSKDDTTGGTQTAASAEYGEYTWSADTGAFTVTVGAGFNGDGDGGLDSLGENFTMKMEGGKLVFTDGSEEFSFEPVRNASDSLVGSWYLGEGFNEQKQIDRHNVLTILDDSNYVIVHNDNEEAYSGDVVEAVSSEWGTYSFDGSTFAVTSVSAELDGPGGLFDDPAEDAGGNGFVNGPGELHPTGQLTLSDNLPVAEGGEPFTLRRLGRYAVTLKDFDGDTKQVYVEASGNDFIGGVTQTLSFADIDGVTPAEAGIYNMDAPDTATIDLVLNQDGSGYMDFDVTGDQNQIDSNGWSVLTSGSLTYVEGGAEWTYLPIKGASPYTTLVYQGDMDLMFITEVTEAPQ